MLKKTLREMAQFYQRAGGDERLLTHVAFDSRKVQDGTLFFALKGTRADGHEFLKEVAQRGGMGAVVSKEYRGPDCGLFLIPVPDVIEALQDLAHTEHSKSSSVVIGVTGTVGKTTMKEFIWTLLSERFSVEKTPGNANSQVSLPLTLINRRGSEKMIVLEMGMSVAGELAKLVRVAPPDVAVLTQVSLVHSANFPDIEAIAQAKCEMFQSLPNKLSTSLLGFFHEQTLSFRAVQELQCKKIVYGKGGHYTLQQKKNEGVIVEKRRRSPPLTLPFTARHMVDNFLGAVAVARHFGLSWEEIARGASQLKPFHHRFERFVKGGIEWIDDTYNASPTSMKGALANLPKAKKKKKIIGVLGAMEELGSFSEASHREVALFALPLIDCLLCFGQECAPMVDVFQGKKPVELFMELGSLRTRLKELAEEGDVVLVKGANSLKMWTIFEMFWPPSST